MSSYWILIVHVTFFSLNHDNFKRIFALFLKYAINKIIAYEHM